MLTIMVEVNQNIKTWVKISSLFIAGLYLLGFIYFPLLGVGNYQLVRIDMLLPSEWIGVTILGLGFIVWAFRLYIKIFKGALNATKSM